MLALVVVAIAHLFQSLNVAAKYSKVRSTKSSAFIVTQAPRIVDLGWKRALGKAGAEVASDVGKCKHIPTHSHDDKCTDEGGVHRLDEGQGYPCFHHIQ